MAAEGDNIVWFTYTGADDEVIDAEATHINVQARVVRARAFLNHRNIVEVICHEDVEKIEQYAFAICPSLRRVIMPGVKIVERNVFAFCGALEDVDCDNLETVGIGAFQSCKSLRKINLPSARIVVGGAFVSCTALTDVKFGIKLEKIGAITFRECESLEQITIPLKDGLFNFDGIFHECVNLRHVHLFEGELQETIVALHLEEWRDDINDEIGLINQILPNTSAGGFDYDTEDEDTGEKAQAIQMWIISVLLKIVYYQVEHRHLLDDAATTLEVVLPIDIVMNRVLRFLELPAYNYFKKTKKKENPFLNLPPLPLPEDDEGEDSDDDTQASESSSDEEEE